MKSYCKLVVLCFLFICCNDSSVAQDISAKDKRQISSIGKQIDKAERYLDSERLQTSAKELGKAYDRIMKMAAVADEALIAKLKIEYDRVAANHKKIKEAGLELPDMAALPEPLTKEAAGSSFVKDVAPILVQRCGRCHVNQSRGEFSAKTFDSLMASTHVSPGRPDTSRLIEVISEGSMPPNGSVPAKDLNTLKQWIRLGAKFDGNDPGQDIAANSGRSNGRNRNGAANANTSFKPTGKETVSFGRDVAPILLENCSGCHISGRRIRGNLNMGNFARMIRGGDSGSPVAAGQPKESLIVKRLRGIDSDVMPPRRKLSEDKIKIVETWIMEGAKFDGVTAQTAIATVAEVAATNAKSHETVVSERDQLADKNWKLIMSSSESSLHSTNNFRVVGGDRLDEVGNLAEQIVNSISGPLGADDSKPFVKGNVSIYLFEKRYDLNELGMMLVNREIENSQSGHWDFTTVDAYSALLLTNKDSIEQIKPLLTQQLTAIWTTSKSQGTPRWFADGTGYLIAANLNRKNDLVRQWQQTADQLAKNLEDPGAFARGKLSERDAGLAGYAFIESLKKSGSLKKLMKRLSSGEPFNDAFAAVLGSSPDDYFKPPRRRRR